MTTLSRRQQLIIAAIAAVLLLIVIALVLLLSRSNMPTVSQSPTPSPSLVTRKLGTDRFAPRPRFQALANVDVGVRTIALPTSTPASSPLSSPPPKAIPAGAAPAAKPLLSTGSREYLALTEAESLAQIPPPSSVTSPSPGFDGLTPVSPPPSTPAPVLPLPVFAPLPAVPTKPGRELIAVYAKGDFGKRQIYVRAVERDKDEQLVASVYDDFGVALSSSGQRVAFYSNEEGPSDSSKARTKLKVVDLNGGKPVFITADLPGNWPAAWSPDGTKLAIPTANSLFIADVTTGLSIQIATPRDPGGIMWAPGQKIYYQARGAGDAYDLYEANAVTGQPRALTNTTQNEYGLTVSNDGARLSFLRDQSSAQPGAALVVREVTSGQERTLSETQGITSYLWNLDMSEVLFTTDLDKGKVLRLKGTQLTTSQGLENQLLLAFDRDYGHVFVVATDESEKALFSLNLQNGTTEKIKAGIPDNVPFSAR